MDFTSGMTKTVTMLKILQLDLLPIVLVCVLEIVLSKLTMVSTDVRKFFRFSFFSVNIEKESTEDVFYRIKACHNVVNLLAVDAKTFVYYKKNNIPITAYKADMKFSGWKGWGGSDRDGKTTGVDVDRKVSKQQINKQNHNVI